MGNPTGRRSRAIDGALLGFAVLSVVWPLLALPALLAVFLWFLIRRGRDRLGTGLLVLAALASFAAFGRFLLEEAIFGIVEAGGRAVEKSMVARVRQVVFAQDLMRSKASIDPDGDRLGSAAGIEELSGLRPLRSGRALDAPMFVPQHARVRATPIGAALEFNRHLIAVCLPQIGGGFSAEPSAAIDDEAAERIYRVYVWPVDGVGATIVADQDEAIALTDRPFSADDPPSCDAFERSGLEFRSFKGPRPSGGKP